MSIELYGCVCGQTFDNKPQSVLDCCRERGVHHSPANEPWEVVLDALAVQAKGEERSEALEEAVINAATLLAAAALVQGGLSVERVAREFEERDYTVKLTYEKRPDRDGEIGVQIIWDDGETLAVGKE